MDTQTAHALEILGYYGLAYIITGLIGVLILLVCIRPLRKLSEEKTGFNNHLLAAIVGFVERILYTSAILVGQPAFIGVWIVLKAVGEWRTPEDKEDTTGDSSAKKVIGTRIGVSNAFMVNQIGTALSILVGVAAGYAIKALLPPMPLLAPLHLPLS
jgi:uncharacterized membrane protein